MTVYCIKEYDDDDDDGDDDDDDDGDWLPKFCSGDHAIILITISYARARYRPMLYVECKLLNICKTSHHYSYTT